MLWSKKSLKIPQG